LYTAGVRRDALLTRTGTCVDASERAVRTFAVVEEWLFSEPMAQLIAAFGGELPDGSRPVEVRGTDWLHSSEVLPCWLTPVLAEATTDHVRGLSEAQVRILRSALALEQLAAADFDFRGGAHYRERSQADKADFDADLRSRVVELADGLGLVSPRQTEFDRYDRTLVLGGGYKSPLLRARYSAQLRGKGIELGELGFLGSPRFLIDEPAERPAVACYAPAAKDEFDLMHAAALAEFDVVADPVEFLCGCASSDERCPSWRYFDTEVAQRTPPAFTHERRARLADRDGRTVGSVLSASTGRPPYRPDTSDTFELWDRCAKPKPKPGERILLVTTQVFVPFQLFEGLRRLFLTYGVEVEAVGFSADWYDRPHTAEYLLQETLSAIRSGRRLLIDAAEILTREA
jgi:hypothetical protein